MAIDFLRYPAVHPDHEKHFELSVITSMNLLVNILWQRAKEKKEYVIERLENRIHVKSDKRVLLGYDFRFATWYTDQKCSWKAGAFFHSLTPLTAEELKRVDVRTREGIVRGQELILDIFHNFRFSPPYIGLQKYDLKAFCALFRTTPLKRVKKVEGVSTETITALFRDLLKENKGLHFSHYHSMLNYGLAELLASHMEAFAASGVRCFFDEMPAQPYFAIFEKFNKDPNDNGDDFEKKDPYREKRLLIYRAAKRNKIEVWPIDNNDYSIDLNTRLNLGDKTMILNIDYFSQNLKEEEKFITLAGAAHYRVAEEYGVPNLLLKMETTRGGGESDDKILQMNRILADQLTEEQRNKMLEVPDFQFHLQTGVITKKKKDE